MSKMDFIWVQGEIKQHREKNIQRSVVMRWGCCVNRWRRWVIFPPHAYISLSNAFCRQKPKEGFGSVSFCLKLFPFLYLSIAGLLFIHFAFLFAHPCLFSLQNHHRVVESVRRSLIWKSVRFGENWSTAAELVVIRRGESDSDVVLHGLFARKKRNNPSRVKYRNIVVFVNLIQVFKWRTLEKWSRQLAVKLILWLLQYRKGLWFTTVISVIPFRQNKAIVA